ncbi:MAG TPA: 1,4-dihydroxy-2-naphthoate polyprenyltransferase, partial [Promineifilum sp.]|nr:1,4-dihydroxy-2-naphthoate polyprenyltransferase [Promineifilum sp.]
QIVLGLVLLAFYHWFLLVAAIVFAVVYVLIDYVSLWQFLFLLATPLLIRNGLVISRTADLPSLNPWLKQMSLASLAFVALFGLGQIIAAAG